MAWKFNPFTGNFDYDVVGTGDVVGPASSTDHAIARYDGVTGKLLQDSGITINDNNEITGPTNTTFNIFGSDNNAGDGRGLQISGGYSMGGDGNGGDLTLQAGDGNGAGNGGSMWFTPGGGAVNGSIYFSDYTSGISAKFNTASLTTADKTFTFPDLSGTFVLSNTTSTDHAIVRFDGTTGKLVQDSSAVVLDNGFLGINIDTLGTTGALGADVAINGGFDTDTTWTKTGNATISDGQLHFAGTSQVSEGAYPALVAGRKYEATYTITAINPSTSGVRFLVGSTGTGTLRQTTGTFTEVITCAGSTSLYLSSCAALVSADIDNLSVREVLSSGLAIQGTTMQDNISVDNRLNFQPVVYPNSFAISLVNEVGNVDAGQHYYYVAFYTALGQTNMRAAVPTGVTTDAANGKVLINLPVSNDYRVVGRRIYRTPKDNANNYTNVKLVYEVANNVDTTYTDNIADSALTGTNYFYQDNTTSKMVSVWGTTSMFTSGLNTIIGYNSGTTIFNNTAQSNSNVLLGINTGSALTTGSKSTFLGDSAGRVVTSGDSNTAVGNGALYTLSTGGTNVAVGRNAGLYLTSGGNNVLIGTSAGTGASGTGTFANNVIIGSTTAAALTSGSSNIILGYLAGATLTSGTNNVIFGRNIEVPTATANGQLNINNLIFGTGGYTGTSASSTPTTAGHIGIGTNAPAYRLTVEGLDANDAISSQVGYNIDVVNAPVAPTGVASAGAGLTDGTYKYHVTYTTALGETHFGTQSAGIVVAAPNAQVTLTIPVSTDARVTGRKIYRNSQDVGDLTLFYPLATIANNVDVTYVDSIADASLTGTGRSNYRPNTTSKYFMREGIAAAMIDSVLTTFGLYAGESATEAGDSVFIGSEAGRYTTTGVFNTYIGRSAGRANTTGGYNVAIGRLALYADQTAVGNTVVGYNAMSTNNAGATNNVAIGYNGGRTISSGSDNTFVGTDSGYSGAYQKVDAANSTAIGHGTYTTANNQVVIGDAGITTAGIGILGPTLGLSIGRATAKIFGIERNASTVGQVLTVRSGGAFATGTDLNGGDLKLEAGISTGSGSSNIRFYTATAGATGTTDRTPTEKLTILGSGNIGIGVTAPSARTHIISTTEQLRVGYDTSNYFTTTVGATGAAIFDGTGVDASFNFRDLINVGDGTNQLKISSGGVLTLEGTAKRHLTMRPAFTAGRIAGLAKPTAVALGAFSGYSMPVFASDDEELFWRMCVPGRWDGASDIEYGIQVALAGAEDVGDKFQFQLSWASKAPGSGVISTSTTDVPVEQTVLVSRSAQYSIYELTFTIDWDLPATDVAASDILVGRLRRIAASSLETAGEIIVLDHCIKFQVDKMFKA
jgi:hypothetical protein